jgi:hypothetical protein
VSIYPVASQQRVEVFVAFVQKVDHDEGKVASVLVNRNHEHVVDAKLKASDELVVADLAGQLCCVQFDAGPDGPAPKFDAKEVTIEQRGAGAAGLIVAMLQHGHVAVHAVAIEPHVLLRIFDRRESACVSALDAEHHPSTPRDGGDRVILVARVQACQVGSAL